MRTHPYAEATYDVVALASGGFGVRVSIPDISPTTVSSFDTEEAAEAWIATHKERVLTQSQSGKIFRRAGRPPATGG